MLGGAPKTERLARAVARLRASPESRLLRPAHTAERGERCLVAACFPDPRYENFETTPNIGAAGDADDASFVSREEVAPHIRDCGGPCGP